MTGRKSASFARRLANFAKRRSIGPGHRPRHRAGRLAVLVPLVAAAMLAGLLDGCGSPEDFIRNSGDGGSLSGTGGATSSGGTPGSGGVLPGTGGAVVGSGGAVVGSGGAIVGSGGAVVGSGGAGDTGGAVGTGGDLTGSGGASGPGGMAATGGAATGGRGTGGAGRGGSGPGGEGGVQMGGAGGNVCPNCMLTVYYAPASTSNSNTIGAEINLSSFLPVALYRISFKYWFTNESGSDDLLTEVDYSALGSTDLAGAPKVITSTRVTPARANADFVTSFAIMSDRTAIEQSRVILRFRIHRRDYQGTFTMANDYSFGTNQTLTMPWPRITAYIDGVLFAGTEPQ
jgi:hypothetical protein